MWGLHILYADNKSYACFCVLEPWLQFRGWSEEVEDDTQWHRIAVRYYIWIGQDNEGNSTAAYWIQDSLDPETEFYIIT